MPRERDGTEETALVRIRSQRGSGENVTYGMNTITNFRFLFAKYLKSEGVAENAIKAHVWSYLQGEEPVGLMVSGGDSIVMLDEQRAKVSRAVAG
ncbi:unnamed protein product [Toxocara canis]|nr:unnamed protein product [Toxocara canis]